MNALKRLLKDNHLLYKTVMTEVGNVSYFETNNLKKNQTTLLLMHGFGATGLDYLPIIKLLQNQYHIISIDLPERGESKLIKSNDFAPSSIADWIYEFIKTIKLEKFHLIGHSMAAHYGLVYAKKYAVESLILLDGGYLVPEDFDDYSLEQELIDTKNLIKSLSFDSEDKLYEFFKNQGNTEEKNIIDRRLFVNKDETFVFTLTEDNAVQMTKDVAIYPDYELIKQINIPVYIIRCDLPKEINKIRDKGINKFLYVKDAKVTVLKNSNHSLYHSKSNEVAELINLWIKETSQLI